MFLLAATPASARADARSNVGGFPYRVAVTHRTKAVKSAPAGYERSWKERVEVIVGTNFRDAAFSRLMRREALESLRQYYGDDPGSDCSSFERCEIAGSLEVMEDVTSASPDVIAANIGTGFYNAGMPHPNSMGARSFIWSRRLNRLLRQSDVFAIPPDNTLRRLAQSNFDNREGLLNPDDPKGIPLDWNHASIGPDGITWSFEPYELGGYLSAGAATISWSALKPYLRSKLPFVIREIRSTRRPVASQASSK